MLFRFRVFFHQSLRHLHGRLAGFESKRQVRLTARIEQQTTREIRVTAQLRQSVEVGLGEGDIQSASVLFDLGHALIASLRTQQSDIQQSDGFCRRFAVAVDELIQQVAAAFVRANEGDTAI